jgi:hypothetical protein
LGTRSAVDGFSQQLRSLLKLTSRQLAGVALSDLCSPARECEFEACARRLSVKALICFVLSATIAFLANTGDDDIMDVTLTVNAGHDTRSFVGTLRVSEHMGYDMTSPAVLEFRLNAIDSGVELAGPVRDPSRAFLS